MADKPVASKADVPDEHLAPATKIDPPVDRENPHIGAPEHLIDQRIAELEAQDAPLQPAQVQDLDDLREAKGTGPKVVTPKKDSGK